MSTTACATTCSATVPLKKDCGEPAHRRSRTVHSAKQSVLHKGWSVRISSNAGAGKGGTIEESAKGLNSTVAVFPLMIMLMLIIFMVQLQSFQKMFLVINAAPLGLIGVVMAFLPTGSPGRECSARDAGTRRPSPLTSHRAPLLTRGPSKCYDRISFCFLPQL